MHRHFHRTLVRFMGRMTGRWTLDACSRFIGVGRWTFGLFEWHQFHTAFRTIAGMIGYDFRMHRARVFLVSCFSRDRNRARAHHVGDWGQSPLPLQSR